MDCCRQKQVQSVPLQERIENGGIYFVFLFYFRRNLDVGTVLVTATTLREAEFWKFPPSWIATAEVRPCGGEKWTP